MVSATGIVGKEDNRLFLGLVLEWGFWILVSLRLQARLFLDYQNEILLVSDAQANRKCDSITVMASVCQSNKAPLTVRRGSAPTLTSCHHAVPGTWNLAGRFSPQLKFLI
jgi:hypothetical protein